MKYGKFTKMTRADVECYLHKRGSACYDNESTDSLKEAAYLDSLISDSCFAEELYSLDDLEEYSKVYRQNMSSL